MNEHEPVFMVVMRMADSPEPAVESCIAECSECEANCWLDYDCFQVLADKDFKIVCNRCVVPYLVENKDNLLFRIGATGQQLPPKLAQKFAEWAIERFGD